MNRITFRQILVAIFALGTIIFNIIANTLPLNGLNTGEISDRFKIFFVPAGYVFSIWGLIYIGMIAYAVYQVLPAQRDNTRLASIAYLFILSCLANVAWLFMWHYEIFEYTLLAMLVLLGSLIAIYIRLDIGRTEVSSGEKWAVHIPFSLYLGWITVATIANTTQLLYYLGWSGWGISAEIWTVIMIAAGVIISALMSFTRADIVYSLVLVWAYIGIAIKHASTPLVANSAFVGAGLILLILIIVMILKYRQQGETATP
ncbi:MAG: tryptophan-rich sensory protein [Chloroflexota bacterium]|nr:MAG: tryptophan-rich sensory protein [Chloroflexota bacterium]